MSKANVYYGQTDTSKSWKSIFIFIKFIFRSSRNAIISIQRTVEIKKAINVKCSKISVQKRENKKRFSDWFECWLKCHLYSVCAAHAGFDKSEIYQHLSCFFSQRVIVFLNFYSLVTLNVKFNSKWIQYIYSDALKCDVQEFNCSKVAVISYHNSYVPHVRNSYYQHWWNGISGDCKQDFLPAYVIISTQTFFAQIRIIFAQKLFQQSIQWGRIP